MLNQKFKILEHTADIALEVYGKNLKELFANAAEGMFFCMGISKKDWKRLSLISQKTKKIKIKSLDKESLLVDFLNELLYLLFTNNKIYSEIKIDKLTDKELEARTREISSREIDLKIEIKAATFHNLEIKKENKNWRTVIIFDI